MRLCPKCKTSTLAELGAGRPAGDPLQIPPSRCTSCKGVWLPHEMVSEKIVPPAVDEAAAAVPSKNDARSGSCPRCRGLLVRARVGEEGRFHLDRCPVCRGIWFDAGEWAAIASTEWLSHLDDLWDPIWRRKVREERAHNRHLETIEQALGPQSFAKVQAAIEVLRDHPNRSLGLSFLIEELGGPTRS